MKKIILMLAMGISTIAFGTVTSNSTTWEGKYECDALPTDAGWTMPGWVTPGAYVYSAGTGVIEVSSLGTDQSPFWYRNDLTVNFSTGFTLEWKVKFIDGGIISTAPCSIGVSNEHTAFAMQGIKIGTADVMGIGVPVNTQDDFHVYRMTVKDGYATLYIDDNVTAATVQPLWAGDFGASMIRFGDVTGDEDAEYQVDYVRWTTQGAFAAVPEPATMILIGLGAFGLFGRRK